MVIYILSLNKQYQPCIVRYVQTQQRPDSEPSDGALTVSLTGARHARRKNCDAAKPYYTTLREIGIP